MRKTPSLDDKLNETGDLPDRGHAEWKRAKVEAGLAQAQDRRAMIPLATVLRELGLEP